MKVKKSWLVSLLLVALVCYVVYRVKFSAPTAAEETRSPVVAVDSSESPEAITGITRGLTQADIDAAEHPTLPLLEIAKRALVQIDEQCFDYTAVLTNQVRYQGNLRPQAQLELKLRHERGLKDGTQIPFSIYLKYREPSDSAGREVIWKEGWNDGQLMVHLTGLLNVMRISLEPTSSHAMKGNLYPVTMIGMRNLLLQIIEKGERDTQQASCRVTIQRGLKLNDRVVTLIESTHPQPQGDIDYHVAKIYLDEELGLPVGYEGYVWPEKEGDPPVLLEKYFYTDIKVNVGLQDIDFDPANPDYDFPGR